MELPLFKREPVSTADDLIAVVPSSETPYGNAFRPLNGQLLTRWLADHQQYKSRKEVENDEAYKQLVTYIVLRKGDTTLCYERGGGDPRLVSKLSIGLGGHVELSDSNPIAAASRELLEEASGLYPKLTSFELAGGVGDNLTPVSRCHYGIVFVGTVSKDAEAKLAEDHLRNPRFLSRKEALANLHEMEEWSALCLRGLGLV